jgi:hypothetical protein
MDLLKYCEWLETTPYALAVRQSDWLFPVIETIHIMALAFSVGTIVFVDLRLVGLSMKGYRFSAILEQLQPWTLAGFGVMFLTGAMLVPAHAVMYYESPFFRLKLLFLLMAGINAGLFHVTIYRSINRWDTRAVPLFGRVIGGVSLLIWTTVVILGRAIAYGTEVFPWFAKLR